MKLDNGLDSSLERLFGEYHVDKNHIPGGLRSLLESSFPESCVSHWIISKDKISASTRPAAGAAQTPRVRRGPPKKVPAEDLDLTGSPLKCSFSMNEELYDDEDEDFLRGNGKYSEDLYVPMSTQEARTLLSKFNLETQNGSQESLPMVTCLTTGESIWAMGSLWKGNSISMYEINYEDNKVISDLISIDKLTELHRAFVSGSAKVESFVTSEYNVVSDHDDFSEIKLFFSWTKPKCSLESPSPSADVSLKVALKPGDEKLATHENWEHLLLLRGFVAGLNNQGIAWRQRSENELGLKEELLALLDRVKNLTPRHNNEFTDVSAFVEAGGDIEDKIGVITDNARQDVDFTDLLWCSLHKVESYDELVFSLTMILRTLQSEEIRPFIYSRNDTKICRIVQNILRGSKEPIPEMSGRLPLDIIIEIGIEKLKRDYIHTLITNELAAQDDIKPLIAKLEDKAVECENLLKLHYVIELALLAQTFLSLGQDDLRTIVNQALKTLIKASTTPISWEEQEFSITLQSSHFRNQLSEMKPVAWKCRLKTSNVKETTCQFSIDPPMPYVMNNSANYKDSADSEISYYNSILSIIHQCL